MTVRTTLALLALVSEAGIGSLCAQRHPLKSFQVWYHEANGA